MRDKDIIIVITIAFFIIYFYPFQILKFISIGIILFFSPGFFILKSVYRDMKGEELILLSFPLSIAISGTIALIFSIFSILSPELMLISSAIIVVSGYFISSSTDFKIGKIRMPDKITTVLIALMLTTIGVWLAYEFNTSQYKEVDIGINSWPKNATLNSTLSFDVYVKNQNYGNANCLIVFSLNKKILDNKSLFLKNGEYRIITFNAMSNLTGKNLASFNLYINGKFYTNVHVYFDVH